MRRSPRRPGSASIRSCSIIIRRRRFCPSAIVVNPNRQDDLSGLGQLCAAGVVFMTLVAVQRLCANAAFFRPRRPPPDLLAGLDLVALATVADVAPLTGLEPRLRRQGADLDAGAGASWSQNLARHRRARGTAAALSSRLSDRSAHQCRRQDRRCRARREALDPDRSARGPADRRGTRPAQSRAPGARTRHARRGRGRRRWLGSQAWRMPPPSSRRAKAGIRASPGSSPRASRKNSGVPLSRSPSMRDGIGTGSGRSIAGVDLGRAVRAAVEAGILVKGGGHAMAAGITIARERLGDFRDFLEAKPRAAGCRGARAVNALLIDAALTAAGANPELAREPRARRPLWRRQSRAGLCPARASPDRRRRGRQRPCAAARAGGRWRQDRRHCVSRRRASRSAGASRRARQPRSSRGNLGGGSLRRQGAGATAAARSCPGGIGARRETHRLASACQQRRRPLYVRAAERRLQILPARVSAPIV